MRTIRAQGYIKEIKVANQKAKEKEEQKAKST